MLGAEKLRRHFGSEKGALCEKQGDKNGWNQERRSKDPITWNRASFHSLTHQVVTKDLQGPGPMLTLCGTRVWECLMGICVCIATTGDNLRRHHGDNPCHLSTVYCTWQRQQLQPVGETEAWRSRTHKGTTVAKSPNAHSSPAVRDGSPGDRALRTGPHGIGHTMARTWGLQRWSRKHSGGKVCKQVYEPLVTSW